MKIGLFLPNLKKDFNESINACKRIGVKGVQLWNVGGIFDPKNLTIDKKKQLLLKIKQNNLVVSALCGHMDFVNKDNMQGKINKFKEILDFGVDIGVPIVTTESGNLPEEYSEDEGWSTFSNALCELCAHAEKIGGYVAIEPGGRCLVNNNITLRRMVKNINSEYLKINYDPGNIVMMGDDPIDGVKEFKDYIIHTHAKDAIRNKDGSYMETVIGEGQVNWEKYIKALKEMGYNGFLTMERENTDIPENDFKKGLNYLKRYL
jgi:sugar phosphate isomerase/epimerase